MKLQAVDNTDKFSDGAFNFEHFKIQEGVQTDTVTTTIMVDRECVIDRIFGRFSEE